MSDNDTSARECCDTPIDSIHSQRCPIIFGPHARSHTIGGVGDGTTYTVHCMCGSSFIADDERDALDAHTRHAKAKTTNPDPLSRAVELAAEAARFSELLEPADGRPNDGIEFTQERPDARDVFDATTPPGVQQLPAVTTNMTPAQFKQWVNSDGTLFMVILPAQRTFVIKVPAAQHEFFVAMMQQVRFALGPEVQAVRMNVVSGDPPAADGTASEAPPWAQPPGGATHKVHCSGEYPVPNTTTGRDVTPSGIIRNPGRGICPDCGGKYGLNNDGRLRLHSRPKRPAPEPTPEPTPPEQHIVREYCRGSHQPFVPDTLSRDGEVAKCPVCTGNYYVTDSNVLEAHEPLGSQA